MDAAPFTRSLSTSAMPSSRGSNENGSANSIDHAEKCSALPTLRRYSGSSLSGGNMRCRCYEVGSQADVLGMHAAVLQKINRKELRCSICFDILCFPVTLPCGHNFDRGCILTAWKYDPPTSEEQGAAAPEEEDLGGNTGDHVGMNNSQSRRRRQHLCPLCRQEAGNIDELQVNILLKDLIAMLYPIETQGAATLEKQLWTRTAPTSRSDRASPTANATSSTRFSFRAVSSFAYVCVASVTDPPGFVLAVLLLMGLIAIAFNPQHALASNASAALTLFDVMDHVFNGFALLIREFSLTLDQLDQLKPWIHAFSFVI